MKSASSRWALGVILSLLAGPAAARPNEDPGARGREALRVWTGKVVCLAEDLEHQLEPDEEACNDPDTSRFALEDSRGERVLFLDDDPQAKMFLDPVVRSRTLRVVGWPRPGNRLEILHLYSVHDGHLHDLYYRCDVCNITATAPGPCWCCQQPFELRETPAESPPAVAREGLR